MLCAAVVEGWPLMGFDYMALTEVTSVKHFSASLLHTPTPYCIEYLPSAVHGISIWLASLAIIDEHLLQRT